VMISMRSTLSVDAITKISYLIDMTPEQSRAARGWLGWSQQELADRASVGISTVRDFEAGRRQPIENNVKAMRRAIEDAGINLVFRADGSAEGIAATSTGATGTGTATAGPAGTGA
jgi:ribosome-binding protein aMBF1 (putative translation factor)